MKKILVRFLIQFIILVTLIPGAYASDEKNDRSYSLDNFYIGDHFCSRTENTYNDLCQDHVLKQNFGDDWLLFKKLIENMLEVSKSKDPVLLRKLFDKRITRFLCFSDSEYISNYHPYCSNFAAVPSRVIEKLSDPFEEPNIIFEDRLFFKIEKTDKELLKLFDPILERIKNLLYKDIQISSFNDIKAINFDNDSFFLKQTINPNKKNFTEPMFISVRSTYTPFFNNFISKTGYCSRPWRRDIKNYNDNYIQESWSENCQDASLESIYEADWLKFKNIFIQLIDAINDADFEALSKIIPYDAKFYYASYPEDNDKKGAFSDFDKIFSAHSLNKKLLREMILPQFGIRTV